MCTVLVSALVVVDTLSYARADYLLRTGSLLFRALPANLLLAGKSRAQNREADLTDLTAV